MCEPVVLFGTFGEICVREQSGHPMEKGCDLPQVVDVTELYRVVNQP